MRMLVRVACVLSFVVAIAMTAWISEAQEPAVQKPADEMTIVDIMNETNKKPVQLLRTVQTGKANDVEKQRLVDLYKSMANQELPIGSLDDWKERTALLVDAAEKVQRGEDGAIPLLRKASNCIACHKEHKIDD